jgi:hypothetical protein
MEQGNKCLTLKIRVEANSEDINAAGRPAGRRDGHAFEINHVWVDTRKLEKCMYCFWNEEVHLMVRRCDCPTKSSSIMLIPKLSIVD